MTLKEQKQKVLRLIEEISEDKKLTSDPDIAEKLNDVINQVMFELCRIKKKLAFEIREVASGEVLDLTTLPNFYQLKSLQCMDAALTFVQVDNLIVFNKATSISLFYYVLPEPITYNTTDDYEFDLPAEVLEIMPYGVAADLLKSDVSTNYGSVYAQRYAEMKQMLDPRYSLGSISFEGGVDI